MVEAAAEPSEAAFITEVQEPHLVAPATEDTPNVADTAGFIRDVMMSLDKKKVNALRHEFEKRAPHGLTLTDFVVVMNKCLGQVRPTVPATAGVHPPHRPSTLCVSTTSSQRHCCAEYFASPLVPLMRQLLVFLYACYLLLPEPWHRY